MSTDPSRLKLIEVVGQGSFGVVHMASWRGSLVAAKVLCMGPVDIKLVEKEIEILK